MSKVFQRGCFLSHFSAKIVYEFLASAMCARYSAQIIPLNLTVPVMYDEHYILKAPRFVNFSNPLSLLPS